MILTITPNPAWDVTLTSPHLERGKTNVVPPGARRAGGKGVNVARVLAAMGAPVRAIVPVGQHDADAFSRDLGSVPHDLVRTDAPTRSTYALVESADNETTMINEAGAERSADDWRRLLQAVEARLPDVRCLVVSGSFPPASPTDILTTLIDAAHGRGIPVIADVAGAHLLAACAAEADVLKPNRDELAAAVGFDDPIVGAHVLQEYGARTVIVSLGAEGVLVIPAAPIDTIWQARTAEPVVGNPTGAGDAAVAALAALLSRGEHRHEEWARIAVEWSADAVRAPRAGELGTGPGRPDILVRPYRDEPS